MFGQKSDVNVNIGALFRAIVPIAALVFGLTAHAQYQRITDGENGFAHPLASGDDFGNALADLGDINGDGISDLAVGASRDNTGGPDRGAIYILFMNADNTVANSVKISSLTVNGVLASNGYPHIVADDRFGTSIVTVRQMDATGTATIAVGAQRDNDGGVFSGAIYLFDIDENGAVVDAGKISALYGNVPTGTWAPQIRLGGGLSVLDLDGDGVNERLVCSATLWGIFTPDAETGKVFILELDSDTAASPNVLSIVTIGPDDFPLTPYTWFGCHTSNIGDVDGDGIPDLAIGARGDDSIGGIGLGDDTYVGFGYDQPNSGAVYIIFLNADGTIKASQKISATEGGLPAGAISQGFHFGIRVAPIPEVNGLPGIAVASFFADDRRGRVHFLHLNNDGTVATHDWIGDGNGIGVALAAGDQFGSALAAMEPGPNNEARIAIGARRTDVFQNDAGAIYVPEITIPEVAASIVFPNDVMMPCADGDMSPEKCGVPTAATCLPLTNSYIDMAMGRDKSDSTSVERVWTATDNCGNQASGTQLIAVMPDKVTLIVPDDTVVECGKADAHNAGAAEAYDSDGNKVPVSYEDKINDDGTVIRTWTAMSACGDVVTADQTIGVFDETAPTIACSAYESSPGLTFSAAGELISEAIFTAEASDNCGNVTITADVAVYNIALGRRGEFLTPVSVDDSGLVLINGGETLDFSNVQPDGIADYFVWTLTIADDSGNSITEEYSFRVAVEGQETYEKSNGGSRRR